MSEKNTDQGVPEWGGPQWVRAGWLVDGQGGAVVKDVLMGFCHGRITRIETSQGSTLRPGRIQDCSSATLMPTLVDAHVHLALSATRDPVRRSRQLSPTFEAARETISAHLAAYLRYGILAVRDGGDRNGHVLDCLPAVQNEDQPRVHVSATCWAWHAQGRYGRMIGRSPGKAAGLANAWETLPDGVGHLKVLNAGLNSLDHFGRQSAPQFSFETLKAAVDHAHQAGLPVMVHANGEDAVAQAIRAGCDSIEHGYFMGPDNLSRLADTQTAWVPTVVPMDALSQEPSLNSRQRDMACKNRDHQLGQVRAAHELGVPIVLGTDAGSLGVDHGVAVFEEMALFRQAGLSLETIVHSAAGRAADLLGLKNSNVLAVGQPATFIVVKGSPSRLIQGLKQIDALCVEGTWF